MCLTERQERVFNLVKHEHEAVGQKRQYTGEEYWVHPYAVAKKMSEHAVEAIEIALCHDLYEDTECLYDDLYLALLTRGYDDDEAKFICDGVNELTDEFTTEKYPELNRKERKKREAERLGKISPLAQSIKYADLIDNTISIVEHDKSFARVYLFEKEVLLDHMHKGNSDLRSECVLSLIKARQSLNDHDKIKDKDK